MSLQYVAKEGSEFSLQKSNNKICSSVIQLQNSERVALFISIIRTLRQRNWSLRQTIEKVATSPLGVLAPRVGVNFARHEFEHSNLPYWDLQIEIKHDLIFKSRDFFEIKMQLNQPCSTQAINERVSSSERLASWSFEPEIIVLE